MEKSYFVYIMSSPSGVLYIGVTNDLLRRVSEHVSKSIAGFTALHNCTRLIYFESASDIQVAIGREKELKSWNRKRKERLIRKINPEWEDLAAGLLVP